MEIETVAARTEDDGVGATLALVGNYKPNAWGLHDMHGNVSEWCRDYYRSELSGGVDPFPSGVIKEGEKVIRGGAWGNEPVFVRAANRYRNSLDDRDGGIGFRLARF